MQRGFGGKKPTHFMIKVKFLKDPTGAFGLAYSAGDTAEFNEARALELIESGFAMKVEEQGEAPAKPETATNAPTETETTTVKVPAPPSVEEQGEAPPKPVVELAVEEAKKAPLKPAKK